MKKYVIRELAPDTIRSELVSYPEFLQDLLYYRGITSRDAAQAFLSPDYDTHVHDPFLMYDMERAVKRILQAVKESERVVIFSDYDTDGIPGGVVLHDFFKQIGYSNVVNYIPHRHHEGFGLNAEAVEQFIAQGATLMLTVDCGSADAKHVARAQAGGIDVIILDHHEIPRYDLPPAYAMLNPKREGETYPFRELCATGVAYKLVQALVRQKDFNIMPGWEKWLLDMVGIATVADMVPLYGENRVLARYGLVVLRKTRRLGLQQLYKDLRLHQMQLSEDDIGFMIGPRINAASRMGSPLDAFQLLTTTDSEEACELSKKLQKLNDERKGLVASMVRDIRKRITSRGKVQDVVVVGDPRWKPSLLGLAANTLMGEFERPVFLWGRAESPTIKGSCRSDGSVDLTLLMQHASDVFLEYGGHAYSGGFSVTHEKVHLLEEMLVDAYRVVSETSLRDSEEEVSIDKRLMLDEVNQQTYRHIQQLAPFGTGNPKPLLLFEGVEPVAIQQFGKEGAHLRVQFATTRGVPVEAISFFAKADSFSVPLREGALVTLVANIEQSFFRGRPELRLRIVDAF